MSSKRWHKDMNQFTTLSTRTLLPTIYLLILYYLCQSLSLLLAAGASLGGPLSQPGSHSNKHIFDVLSCLGRSLIVLQILVTNKSGNFLLVNLAIRCVSFVTHKHETSIGVGVAFDLVDPVAFDVLEGVAVGEVEDEKNGVGV